MTKLGCHRAKLTMWKIAAILGLCALAAGCGDLRSRATSIAEDTRNATERRAARADAAEQARLAQVAEEAAALREGGAIALGERYFVRADGLSWSVIDRETNAPASVSGQRLQQLSLEEAEGFVNDLRADARRNQ